MDLILDSYEEAEHLKFPTKLHEDISVYLDMDRDYIEALSKEDRYNIAIRLAQISFYVQRLVNREKARMSWAENTIQHIAAKHWGDFSEYLKADIKIELIARENVTLDKVIKIRNHARIRVDDLDGLSAIIKHIAEIMSRSAYGKE